MYTNPTDYFMGLMKDDVAASGLADAWRRASAADVAVKAPPPVLPISCRKVADDPSLHAAGEFYEADEAGQSAHSVLQVRHEPLCRHTVAHGLLCAAAGELSCVLHERLVELEAAVEAVG